MLIVCAEQARVEAELVGGLLGVRRVGGCWGRGGMLGSGCCAARSGIGCCGRGGRGAGGARARTCCCRIWRCCGVRTRSSVIGAAIEAKVAGEGHRRIAGRLGVHADTVRGWLRRFAERAERDQGAFHAVGGRAGSGARGGAAGRQRRSRTRWRRSRSPRGRGCCGSGRAIRGGSRACCRAACCWQHEFPLPGGAVS